MYPFTIIRIFGVHLRQVKVTRSLEVKRSKHHFRAINSIYVILLLGTISRVQKRNRYFKRNRILELLRNKVIAR